MGGGLHLMAQPGCINTILFFFLSEVDLVYSEEQ